MLFIVVLIMLNPASIMPFLALAAALERKGYTPASSEAEFLWFLGVARLIERIDLRP